MSPIYTPGKLTLAKTNNGITDPDAIIYINNVEVADGQNLEYATAKAMHDFVVGCKTDGIWNAIKASCILAGARTRLGALTPLVGAAPTSIDFVDGDYNRKTGLVGNGSTKYLNSNRNNNADPQDNIHLSCYITGLDGGIGWYMGQGVAASETTGFARRGAPNDATIRFRARTTSAVLDINQGAATGFAGLARSASSSFSGRAGGISSANTSAPSLSGISTNLLIFTSSISGITTYSNARLAFYSIGEALDLALLDARVTALYNAIGAAF